MICIDGSYGEGGGQILRTALSLALVTGKPFRIEKIRANRSKSGLMRQHLTAVNAAAEIGNATVSGNRIGSQTVTFAPQTIQTGRFHYSIGSAGSCTLVLQTILPALMLANGPSQMTLEGGTHNPFAPPFDFLVKVFLPLIGHMGPQVDATLERPGFFPAGGGRFTVRVTPVPSLKPLQLTERGTVQKVMAQAMVSNLPVRIARRELKVVAQTLGCPEHQLRAVAVDNAQGPGNIVTIEIESDALTELFTGFGQKGVSAESVATRVANQARDYLKQEVPVGRYLADQLLVPMALAGEGTFFTLTPSRHTLTNATIIQHFMGRACDISESAQGRFEVKVRTDPLKVNR